MGMRCGWWMALVLAAALSAAERDAWEAPEMPTAI